jgi:t-SNARE complex subunit (syntaxin)
MYTNVDYDRRSLNNALSKGDYIRAFEKVNENIKIIDSNMAQIREYSLKIGSKQENNQATEESNELIESTTKYIIDSMNYLSDIKNFEYSSNIQKKENIEKANSLEVTVQKKKNILQKLIDNIKNQGQEYINNARNSLRIIEEKERESSINNEDDDGNEQQLKLLNGREYIEGIHDKENQINVLKDVTLKLNELSKFQAEKVLESGQKINTIEDNVNQMNSNIANAVEHMREAKKYNESAGGYTNYCLYIIGGIVLLLILLVLIMPSS